MVTLQCSDGHVNVTVIMLKWERQSDVKDAENQSKETDNL